MQLTAENPSVEHQLNRPRANYFEKRHSNDPFPDPFLIDPEGDITDDDACRKDIDGLLDRAKIKGFPYELWAELEKIV